jgi:ribosomal protein RSM22 (predicted rRNA methylase)
VTTWTVPAAVEDALRDAARRHLPEGVVGGSVLTAAVVDRSKRYTSERERLAEASPRDLAARALFFTVADAPKAVCVLAELGDGLRWHGDDPLRVLDLGAGCGAMSLGALVHAAAAGATRPLAIEAVDQDAAALAILADAVPAAARALGVAATVTTRRADLPGAALPRAELILAGTVLNELDDAAALALTRAALAALADDGALVLIEPALRETTRALHRLRDAVIAAGAAHVFAPCTRRAAPCPMLADERDWCHEERGAALPPRAARLAQVTGLRDGAMKYSYLVLRHRPGHVGGTDDALRVVGHPQRSKGKLELPVCGQAGLTQLRVLKRDRATIGRAVQRARRGDVLHLDGGDGDGDDPADHD